MGTSFQLKGFVQKRENYFFKTFQETIKLFEKHLNKDKMNLDTLDHDKK